MTGVEEDLYLGGVTSEPLVATGIAEQRAIGHFLLNSHKISNKGYGQCCGSGSGSGRIRNFLKDPDPE
jgi:hypothetical protein